jgi:uncharacterized DUF497 family protein
MDLDGFDWNEANKNKNWIKHKVKTNECEEVFFDNSKVIYKDILHSGKESRFILIGKTKKLRMLFVVFTIRNKKVRIISARDTDKEERRLYEKND